MQFNTYKFRCSGLKNLMIDPKLKADKEAGNLSETTKSYLKELWIEAVYGRKKDISSKFMEKGTIVESDSLDLVQEALGKTYFKNQDRLENDFITGTPDVKSPRLVDIKSCWDIFTFAKKNEVDARKDYFYQLLGYMWLTGATESDLIYTLVNTPEIIINDELYRMSKYNPKIGQSDAIDAEVRKNFIYDDIEAVVKVKLYTFLYQTEEVEKLKLRIIKAREYMNGLSL